MVSVQKLYTTFLDLSVAHVKRAHEGLMQSLNIGTTINNAKTTENSISKERGRTLETSTPWICSPQENAASGPANYPTYALASPDDPQPRVNRMAHNDLLFDPLTDHHFLDNDFLFEFLDADFRI